MCVCISYCPTVVPLIRLGFLTIDMFCLNCVIGHSAAQDNLTAENKNNRLDKAPKNHMHLMHEVLLCLPHQLGL